MKLTKGHVQLSKRIVHNLWKVYDRETRHEMAALLRKISIYQVDNIWYVLKPLNLAQQLAFYEVACRLAVFDTKIDKPSTRAKELKTWLETIYFEQKAIYLGYNPLH